MGPPGHRPLLVVLVGPVASGKTTLAWAIGARLPALIVANDEIRGSLFAPPRFTPDEHAAVYAEAVHRITEGLRTGGHVVFDGTNLVGTWRDRLHDAASDVADILYVVLYTPP